MRRCLSARTRSEWWRRLAELSQTAAPGAHAAVLIDGAGYHIAGDLTVPDNITLVRLPSYSPELNAIEKLWQFMRENILSHRLFDSLDHIIDALSEMTGRPRQSRRRGLTSRRLHATGCSALISQLRQTLGEVIRRHAGIDIPHHLALSVQQVDVRSMGHCHVVQPGRVVGS